MTRVSTFGNYQSALLDMMTTQARGAEAQARVSTKKNATSLAGFGRTSETVTALKSSASRIQGFIETGKTVAARMTMQDLAFDRVGDSARAARQAIADALAANRVEGLMADMQSLFQAVQDGMNMQHQGKYLFAGSASDTAPVTVRTMAELAALGDTAAAFANRGKPQSSWLDEGVTMTTGFLADAVGSELFDIFRDLQLYHQGTPLEGQPDQAAKDFLTAIMGRLEAATTELTNVQAVNGAMQSRVDTLLESQEGRQIALETLLSDKTDADMARALADVELAQLSLQASAQVISQLRNSSLLNYLR